MSKFYIPQVEANKIYHIISGMFFEAYGINTSLRARPEDSRSDVHEEGLGPVMEAYYGKDIGNLHGS